MAYDPDCHIYKEKYVGIDIDKRITLKKLKKIVLEGDTVIFDSITCLSTSIEEAYELYLFFFKKHVDLAFIKEPSLNAVSFINAYKVAEADFSEHQNVISQFFEQFILTKISLDISAYLKANSIRLSQRKLQKKESYQKSVRKGKKPGWKKGRSRKNRNEGKILRGIKKLSKKHEGVLSDRQVMKLIGISHTTYYKYEAILKEKENSEE